MTRLALLATLVVFALGCRDADEVAGDPPSARQGNEGDAAGREEAKARRVLDDAGVETAIYEVERTPTPELLPPVVVAQMVREGEAVLCDVNAPEARAYFGVIPGAIELSHPSRFDLDELPAERDVPLIFYCSTPSCGASLESGTRAILAGYRDVYALRGGIAKWIEGGGETASAGELDR